MYKHIFLLRNGFPSGELQMDGFYCVDWEKTVARRTVEKLTSSAVLDNEWRKPGMMLQGMKARAAGDPACHGPFIVSCEVQLSGAEMLEYLCSLPEAERREKLREAKC